MKDDNMFKTKLSNADASKCTGCAACYSVCPNGAIELVANREGFVYPEINSEICTNCNLCRQVCSITNNFKEQTVSDCYAVMASDDIRSRSSSGGIFTLLAMQILSAGGYVCGAAFNNKWEVEHIIINNIKDLDKLCRSKYVQSDTHNIMKPIKSLLDNGEKVLFCGCPCQVEGLKLFLQKDYENLITIDLICHGVPSQKVFDKFLEECFRKQNIVDVNFRNKLYGWNCITTILTTDGYLHQNNDYFNGFIEGMYMRECCYKCKYTTTNRPGDLTIGDFWGVSSKYNDGKGTSQVLVNNPKGETLLDTIKDKCILLHKSSKKEFLNSPNLRDGALSNPTEKSPNREDFFNNFDKSSFHELIKKYSKNSYDIAIINFANGNNYGALLVGFAMQEILKTLGYSTKHINYITPELRKKNTNNSYKDFVKKYLELTREYYNYRDLINLNDEADIFISGSDQVWRHCADCCFEQLSDNKNNGLYVLSYINDDKKKIGYAASFGERNIPKDYEYANMMTYFLSRFDFISVRENFGKEICKKYFKTDATQTLDPVLLGGRELTEKLAKHSNFQVPDEKYFAYYILDNNKNNRSILEHIEKNLNIKGISTGNENEFKSVEDFINIIKHSEFVVTDSFHGNILSIIYNKPYIAIRNLRRGQDRFTSLAEMLHLQSRLINNINDIKKLDNQLLDIDYNKVNLILETKRKESLLWLKNAIESPKNKAANAENDMLNLLWFKIQKEKAYCKRVITLLHNKKTLRRKYCWNKLLSFITFGKLKNYYINKRIYYKSMLKEIKDFSDVKSLKFI